MKKIQLLLAVILLSCSVYGSGSKDISRNAFYHSDEPAHCQHLQPTDKDRLALSDWVLAQGAELKQQGCWKSHIYWGEQALKEARKRKQFDQQRALLLSLASSFFYLGDYVRCLSFAKAAETLSDPVKDWKTMVESLYLQSAVARVQSRGQAVKLAEKALSIIDQQKEPAEFLRGKVLYNLAAALTDGEEKNLARAREVLIQAEALFKEAGSQYDVSRTVIRLARVCYLQKDYDKALKRLNSIQSQLVQPRTRMLFFQQRAKVLLAMNEWQAAGEDIEKARELAVSLDARADLDRIKALQVSIDNNNQPSP
ncbi:hypothetical protein GZ77_15300 [Endozoicomonas montiporae]|uniref:MalT-like TPR region domain-containing protein n=2 Tax=Endozoicomonas montiporae TaxID=1027273 RepID=A0A081N5E6_9GAMM|nr:hypothetical protein [Endozoicomonas montiporae]AMO57446.1 hypothetical protein EZMO1_3458 [Endozoicomonas montiporae CL-33]KEQ13669.1 hypothetical protein GZ77_15300 [Endozoicomonas montiporae]